MSQTEPVRFINRPLESYYVAARFSSTNTAKIRTLIQTAEHEFGASIFGMPDHALHITVLDWISPVDGYNDQPRQQLFEKLYPDCDTTLSQVLAGIGPITVRFNSVKASPSTIFITGQDEGQFTDLRTRSPNNRRESYTVPLPVLYRK